MSSDLAFTLIASFGIFFMGILVYFHDQKSVSSRLFFFMSLSTVLWSLANYFSLNAGSNLLLFWIRMVLFFAAPHAVLFFLFIYNFPGRNLKMQKLPFGSMLFLLALTMGATLSPFVFSRVDIIQNQAIPIVGPLMPLFALLVIGSLVFGLILILKKYIEARDVERTQWKYMLVGVSLSYFLLITTNFLLVVMFSNTYFVTFGPLFMLPAVLGMGYAIMRHRLFNIKAIATEILTFAILSISLFEVLVSKNILELILRIIFFGLFFIFGIFLIKSVLREVEQREKLEVLTKELETANKKLKELDKLKSEFLSFASHQVKAPMTAIKGFASLIIDGNYGQVSEKIKEVIEKIKDSTDRMIMLVNNLLDLRRIEEGRMDYKFKETNIFKLVFDIIDGIKSLAQRKGLELKFNSEPLERILVNIDSQKFGQAVQNLIENAIKYTEKGGVDITINKESDNSILITIADSGRGISKELLSNLFEQYKRDESLAKQIEGTGLGLYIAKVIVVAHKGEIWAESEGQDKGSKFFIKLPLL